MVLHRPMDALTEAMLVFAARRDHIEQVIRPALARGAWVLSDRFTDATFAYQGAGRGFDAAVLGQLEAWVQQGLQPELTLLFDLSPTVAAARLLDARQPDRFEALDVAFFERVRVGYLSRASLAPQRFAVIAADAPPQAVADQVRAVLLARGLA
jgi:dTMP kinase